MASFNPADFQRGGKYGPSAEAQQDLYDQNSSAFGGVLPQGSGASKSDFFGSSATKAGVNFLDNYLKNLDKQRRTDPRTGEEKEKSPLAMAASSSQLASGLSEQRDPFYMMKTGGKFIPGSKGIGERLAGAAVGFAKGAMTGQPHMAGIGAVGGFLS